MEQREIEKELGELEERVDRLRVLYEQYFLGFEKLEPSVPRKDVERRFAILRKENIRNTALRYRFNVVNQKYNTYGMHWTRICRQIEEGTFKRHLKRAQERFGDGAAAAQKRKREGEDVGFDVDIDFEDLDSMNVDDVLADADRAVAKYERPPVDTVPPAPPSAPPSVPGHRVARPAPLPTAGGSKPKLIRKVVKAPEAAPPSNAMRSDPPDSAPTPPPPARPAPTPSGGIRGPMPAAPSAGRIPAASPSGRMPAGTPSPPQSDRRLPVPAAPPSERRLPVPPPAAPPGVPLSERRLPVPPPAGPPGVPVSERRLPVPAGGGSRPMIRPAIRPATQSQPDLAPPSDRPSQPRQPPAAAPAPASSRSRVPLPLPSQLNREKKD